MRRLYAGRIDEAGLVHMEDEAAWRQTIRRLRNTRVHLTIAKATRRRSLDQNAYLHAVPFPMLADRLGYDRHDLPLLKLCVLGEWGGWTTFRDRPVPRYPSTSDLTTAQCTDLIDWLIRWAASEHDLIIPAPNEIDMASYDDGRP